jgi:Sec-independent protein translocase protein TatA
MFDNVSWGEILIVGSIGIAITGKRDIPKVCNFVGIQLGRVVGLLQGARVRADQFTQHNELKSLQNELRSGLRELDQVKTELAIAASSSGMVGRSLGPTTMSANNNNKSNSNNNNNNNSASMSTSPSLYSSSSSSSQQQAAPAVFSPSSSFLSSTNNNNNILNNHNRIDNKQEQEQQQSSLQMKDFDFHIDSDSDDHSSSSSSRRAKDNMTATATATAGNDMNQHQQQYQPQQVALLSPVLQTERAVMEEEWKKQGIGFRARAEQGLWIDNDNDNDSSNNTITNSSNNINTSNNDGSIITDTTRATGSELLEHLQREVLIFDQYDRVVGEQENQIKQRIDRIQKERKTSKSKSSSKSKSKTTNK